MRDRANKLLAKRVSYPRAVFLGALAAFAIVAPTVLSRSHGVALTVSACALLVGLVAFRSRKAWGLLYLFAWWAIATAILLRPEMGVETRGDIALVCAVLLSPFGAIGLPALFSLQRGTIGGSVPRTGETDMTSQDHSLTGDSRATLELGDLRLSLYTQPAAGLFARWRKPLTLVRVSSPTFTADFPSGEVIALEHGPIVCESVNGDPQSVGFLASPSVIHKDSAVGATLSGQVFPDGALLFLKGSDLIAVITEQECSRLIKWLIIRGSGSQS